MEQHPHSEVQLAIAASALAGDSGSLYRLAAGLLDQGVPFESVLFDVLLQSQRDVGERWQIGDYLVAEEHAATASLETVISLLAGSFEQPQDGVPVVVATAQGDTHSLPARAVAAHLLFLGYRTTYLGADVLASDLREYLESDPPQAVVLSCAMTGHLFGARYAVQESHAVGVPVIVGGEAFGANGVWAANIGADAWVRQPRDVATHLETWDPDPGRAEARAKNPDHLLERVIDTSSAVLADAESRLARSLGRPVGARWRTELNLAFWAAAASMLVEDTSLLSEFLNWQARTLHSHGLEGHAQAVESLGAALGDVVPEAGIWVERAHGHRIGPE
jgi:methanogenic corrinoid protein MtbC1